MAFPSRREHRFTLDGEGYLLVGWTRGADRRIRAEYAAGIAAAPAVLDAIDGADLYVEAVARECLKEAPEIFWETRPAAASQNGILLRVATFDQVPLELWEAFRKEVETFVALFRPAPTPTLHWYLTQAKQDRTLWRLLKLFPHALSVGLSDEELTEEQWRWFECHLLLDDGVDACPACDALGSGAYCTVCGTALGEEARTCEQCQSPGLGAYCRHCGTPLRHPVAEAIAEDRFDWDAWASSLTPFLGGLTPREQELLRGNGVPHAFESGA